MEIYLTVKLHWFFCLRLGFVPASIIKEKFFCYYIICDIQLNNLDVVSEHDWVKKFLNEHVSEIFYVYIIRRKT